MRVIALSVGSLLLRKLSVNKAAARRKSLAAAERQLAVLAFEGAAHLVGSVEQSIEKNPDPLLENREADARTLPLVARKRPHQHRRDSVDLS